MREIVKRKDPENEITEARRELEKIEAIIDRFEDSLQIRANAWAKDEIEVIIKALQVHASAIRVLKLGEGTE